VGLFGKLTKKLHMDDPAQVKRELRWLLDRSRMYRGGIAGVCVLGLLGTALGLGGSVASKYLIDAVTGDRLAAVVNAGVLMALMTLGSILFQAVSARYGAAVHVKTRADMQQNTYGRILRAGWEALEPFRSGDLMHRLTADVAAVSDGIISFLPNALSALVRLVGALGIMIFFDPTLALLALAGVPLTMVLSRLLLGKIRDHDKRMKEMSGNLLSFQEDSFRNLTSIKAFSVTELFTGEMSRLQQDYTQAYLSFSDFKITMSAAMSAVSMLVSGICLAWGVFRLWTGDITIGTLTLFLQLASTLRGAFSALVGLAQQAVGLMTSAGRILAVEELPGEDGEVPQGLDREETLTVRLEGVSFHYRGGEPVLRPFDFEASPGEFIAITGPSGEGKTTLLRLLLGLVAPDTGRAVAVGRDTYELNAGTRRIFAYVPQGSSMFAGTVRENLCLVKPDATEAELEQALEQACALDFVRQLPDGLDHPLGAGGRGLSEGQTQRLAIARALLRKAPVLLLDEATSALDVDTERRILENLRRSGGDTACVLVTHRPASAQLCGRAYEIRDGAVTEVRHGA